MKVIIVGCGKLGLLLAKQLSDEDTDVTVIDQNAEKLSRALSMVDVQGVAGNGTSFRTQAEAGVPEGDLMIAVTGADEVNLLCCLIAKHSGVKHTIARVRNPVYNDEVSFLSGRMGISMDQSRACMCRKYSQTYRGACGTGDHFFCARSC